MKDLKDFKRKIDFETENYRKSPKYLAHLTKERNFREDDSGFLSFVYAAVNKS